MTFQEVMNLWFLGTAAKIILDGPLSLFLINFVVLLLFNLGNIQRGFTKEEGNGQDRNG